jgi:3',5'-cyclic AMP phosphodiesterase CpdA
VDIRILHLSDLHFAEKIEKDQNIVLSALAPCITSAAIGQIDLVIFSGDLAYSGSQIEFEKARTEFIDKVLAATNLSNERLIVCPGNHDIDRRIVRKYPYVETGLVNTLQSRLTSIAS